MMKNIDAIKNRYMKDTISVRLGGIAANLARVSSFLENEANGKVAAAILEESKYFIEWVAPEAPFKIQALFAEIQPILALWQSVLSKNGGCIKAKGAIRKKAKTWSAHILRYSGLLKQPFRK